MQLDNEIQKIHAMVDNNISTLQKEHKSNAKVLSILKDQQNDFFRWMRTKHPELTPSTMPPIPTSDELKARVEQSRKSTHINKAELEALDDYSYFLMLPSLLELLGLHDTSNELKFRLLKEEVRPLLTVKIDQFEKEVLKEEALKERARQNGRSGGQTKAEKNERIVFFALQEYVENYSDTNLSLSTIAKKIKIKVNDFIISQPELRSSIQPFTEDSEAILKWISNYSYFIKHNVWKPKTSEAVMNFHKSQHAKKSEPSC